MTVTSQSLRRGLGLIVLLWIGGCAKGATTLADTTGKGGAGGGGGAGALTTCGNGVMEPTEQCDPLIPLSATCASLNIGNGVLACNKITCVFDTSMCGMPQGGVAGTAGH